MEEKLREFNFCKNYLFLTFFINICFLLKEGFLEYLNSLKSFVLCFMNFSAFIAIILSPNDSINFIFLKESIFHMLDFLFIQLIALGITMLLWIMKLIIEKLVHNS